MSRESSDSEKEEPERESGDTLQPDDCQQYVDFFENAGIPMHLVGPDGTVLDANTAELDALGYSREEYLGNHIANFHADQDVIDDILERLRSGEELQDYEARMVRKDGSIRHVLINASVNWNDGEFVNTRCVTRDITERKQYKREVERHNDRLEEIYGRISDAFFALDEDWQFTHLNEQAHNVINPDGRTLKGKNVWEEFPAATERKFKPKYEQAMYDQQTVSFEEYYPEPLDAWFEVRAYPSETGLSIYFRDITDRKERERQLRESEHRFRTLAESFPNGGVHYFDEDLRYQYVSGSGFDPIDTSPEDLVGSTIYEIDPYTTEVVELLEPLMEATLEGNEKTTEIPYEGRVFEVHSVPLRAESGAVTGGFFITQDITEQNRRERKLEARSAALSASIDGIAILDADGMYTFVNQAHADIYGYDDPDAFIGNSWRMCYGESECERFEMQVMPTLNAEGQWRGEARGTRKDGSTFSQELSLSVTVNGRVICIARDISERKKREQQLARQNERLEEFTSVVSHDLRNPLSVASGRLALAREECQSPQLAKASESIDRAIGLVEELHALAKEGEAVGEVETVELEQVVEDAWQTVETSEATLTIESSQPLCADRSRTRQLCENLFRNAIEHGGEAVSVRAGWEEAGFYIADDGPGIPLEDREQVFETGHSTAESGAGYGLNIVAEIVAAHDWKISVPESEAGGARFDITGVEATAE